MSRPRLHDEKFLAFLRTKPCCICGRVGETEAAHIRIGFRALGKKPDDKDATPLCAEHHREQHSMNETIFWATAATLPIDPFLTAERFYAEFGGTGGKPKAKRKPKPRKPKHLRQKIASRGFQRRKKQ